MRPSPDHLGDATLRRALLRRLSARHEADPQALIVEELGLRHGRSRVDVAVVNGRLEGFEIKSRKDSLVRLPSQVATYSLVLDRATLLCDEGHVEEAASIAPGWWGVLSAEVGPRGGVKMMTVRRPRQNPSVDPASVIKLLWRDEALAALEELGMAVGLRGAPRRELYKRLVENLDPTTLRARVRACLRFRTAWRFAGLYRPYGD